MPRRRKKRAARGNDVRPQPERANPATRAFCRVENFSANRQRDYPPQ